jgi:NAD(P)-dependent dehydrogenase (short-subunit alcohol dehydrogenase family)
MYNFDFVKWIVSTYQGWLNLAFDIVSCFFLAIPLMLKSAWELVFPKRKDVHGKLVAIIGAGSKLSRSIALNLAALGCKIALVDLNEDNSERIVEDLKKNGTKAERFHTDITKIDEIRKLREDIEFGMGKVDILINAADVMPDPGKKTGPGFIELMLQVNLYGTIQVSSRSIR